MKKFMLAIFVLAASTVALAQSQFLRRTVAPRDWFFAAPAVNNVTNISNPAQGSIALDTSLSTPAFYGNVGTPITPNWVNLQGGGSGTLTLRTTSSNPDNCNSADQVVTLTANSATVTKNLCGASAVPNKVITLIHGGISLSNEYLITPSGSDTINGGSPGASYNLYTNGEKVTLVSDGVSNWQIIQHETETGWVDAEAMAGDEIKEVQKSVNAAKIKTGFIRSPLIPFRYFGRPTMGNLQDRYGKFASGKSSNSQRQIQGSRKTPFTAIGRTTSHEERVH